MWEFKEPQHQHLGVYEVCLVAFSAFVHSKDGWALWRGKKKEESLLGRMACWGNRLTVSCARYLQLGRWDLKMAYEIVSTNKTECKKVCLVRDITVTAAASMSCNQSLFLVRARRCLYSTR